MIDISTGRRGVPSYLTKRTFADSDELDKLRWRLVDSNHRFAHERITATRLGIYAAESGIKVTDFGQHSAKWIREYKAAIALVRRVEKLRVKLSQPLT